MHLHLDLPQEPTAGAHARRAVGSWLSQRGLEALADDAALLTGELVANALQHGEHPLALHAVDLGDAVRITVDDAGHGVPAPRRPGPDEESGRGLLLVAAVSRRWGVVQRPGGGSAVWAELAVTASRTP